MQATIEELASQGTKISEAMESLKKSSGPGAKGASYVKKVFILLKHTHVTTHVQVHKKQFCSYLCPELQGKIFQD